MIKEQAPSTPTSTASTRPMLPSLFPKTSYETSKRWNRSVSIDGAFMNIMSTRTLSTPNTRSGRTPSLAETLLTSSGASGVKKTKSRWKASFPVTGFRLRQSSTSDGDHVTDGQNSQNASGERKGTVPVPLPSPRTGSLSIVEAVFAKSRLKKAITKRKYHEDKGGGGGGGTRWSLPRLHSAASSASSSSPPQSPKVFKKGFKQMAQQVVFQRRVSEGIGVSREGAGSRPSVGDVFMHELVKQMDRKQLSRLKHIAGLQAIMDRKRKLLRKFKMAVHITLWCIKSGRRHCVQAQDSRDLSSFFNLNFSAMDTFEGVDLLFDPSKFKANRQSRIPKEMKRIFRKDATERTDQEIYYAQIALRNIKCFAEFPERMQKKIAEVGMYQRFEPRRVLLRQGHEAHSFYFILSGAVSVLVVEEGGSFAKVAAHLEKGQTFGELAIITRGKRQSSVVVKEKSEFLAISVDDYHKIFMSGGVKSTNDPDHEMFIKSLPFLQGWPLQKLEEDNAKCVFLYFKRGDVIIKDSKYSDWIVVVKSGSLAVLKKLRKVEAYEWKKPKAFTFTSDKEKRERHERLTKMRKQVLPELQVPLKASSSAAAEGLGSATVLMMDGDLEIREEGRLRPFVHPTDPPRNSAVVRLPDVRVSLEAGEGGRGGDGGSVVEDREIRSKKTEEEEEGGREKEKAEEGVPTLTQSPPSASYLNVPHGTKLPPSRDEITAPAHANASATSSSSSSSSASAPTTSADAPEADKVAERTQDGQDADGGRENGQTFGSATIPEEEENEQSSSSRLTTGSSKGSVVNKNGPGFKSDVRTIQQELDDSGQKKDPDDVTAADLNPEFVHLQTLTKGMVFGLSDLILGGDSSFCVVSNGADVLLINKQFYADHASEGLIRSMRQALCPYPSEEVLQNRLQTSVDWDAYRQTTLRDTLRTVRLRKDPPMKA